jgi:hypothetical protein
MILYIIISMANPQLCRTFYPFSDIFGVHNIFGIDSTLIFITPIVIIVRNIFIDVTSEIDNNGQKILVQIDNKGRKVSGSD